ncbi:MAG: addiction module toxin RelE [Eubacterium sp.]|nr:addiction module toxin RelE [Eubacterium sp.]
MKRTFIQTTEFSKRWESLGFNVQEDLAMLEADILSAPKKYPVIPGTGSLRKMRWSSESHGKRGGVRVCYIDFDRYETVYLITTYSKNESDDLSPTQKKTIKKLTEILEKELEGLS